METRRDSTRPRRQRGGLSPGALRPRIYTHPGRSRPRVYTGGSCCGQRRPGAEAPRATPSPKNARYRLAPREPPHVQRGFARVVITPLARLPARRPGARGHMVPAVGPVIHRVQQQPLVRRVGAEVHVAPGRTACRACAGPPVRRRCRPRPARSRTRASRSRPCEAMAAAELSTGSWSLNGSAARLAPVTERCEPGRARVPVRDAVSGGGVARCSSRAAARAASEHPGVDSLVPARSPPARLRQRWREIPAVRRIPESPRPGRASRS